MFRVNYCTMIKGILAVVLVAQVGYVTPQSTGEKDVLECLEHYMAISSASGAREQCNFVIKFTDCMSLAVRSMTMEESQKYVKLVERAQEMSPDCTGVVPSPFDPKLETFDQNIRISVDRAKDIRFRRITASDDVSIFDIMEDVAALKEAQLTEDDVKRFTDAPIKAALDSLTIATMKSEQNFLNYTMELSNKLEESKSDNKEALSKYDSRLSTLETKAEGINTNAVQTSKNKDDINDLDSRVTTVEKCSEQSKFLVSGKCVSAAQFGDETILKTCDAKAVGQVRYNKATKAIEICDGSDFVGVGGSSTIGTSDKAPAASCDEIYTANPNALDGKYFLKFGNVVKESMCRFSNGQGWTMLLKAKSGSMTFHYETDHWRKETTLGTGDLDFDYNTDAKYDAFNKLPIRELLIVTPLGSVQLRCEMNIIKKPVTLLEMFTKFNPQLLEYVAGAKYPAELFVKDPRLYWNTCGVPWRLNTVRSSFRTRIGGTFSHYWSCNYGNDARGQPTGASSAGLGVYDRNWSPFTHSLKSAGVRHAHDYSGQVNSAVQVYGR